MAKSLAYQALDYFRSRPADEEFDPWCANNCAGHQFLRSAGYPVRKCWIRTWEDISGVTHELPEPLAEAIEWASGHFGYWTGAKFTFGALADRLETALSIPACKKIGEDA